MSCQKTMYELCRNVLTVTIKDDQSVPVVGLQVVASMKDLSGAQVPELDGALLVETPANSGVYVYTIPATFNPENTAGRPCTCIIQAFSGTTLYDTLLLPVRVVPRTATD